MQENKIGGLDKRFHAESHSLRNIGHNHALRKEVRGKQTKSINGEEQGDKHVRT